MKYEIVALLDAAIGLRADSDRDRALLTEMLTAFFSRMPWLYAILMVNLSGMLVSISEHLSAFTLAGAMILILLTFRLIHWINLPRRTLTQSDVTRELRSLFVIGAMACAAYCVWTVVLYTRSSIEDRNHIVLFGSLAALGCSFALSPLPSVSRLPLFLLALPLALLLICSGQPAFVGMGITLLTLIYVLTKLIDDKNLTFRRLVNSRFDVELAKQRAESAERIAIQERSLASTLADTDVLTGLANRRALLSKIELQRRAGASFAIALIDLDGFKPVNDTFGHVTGDALLVEVSRKLQAVVGSLGVVARLGGDEFAILLSDCDDADVRAVVGEAIAEIEQPFSHDRRILSISACSGIACGWAEDVDPTTPIRMAYNALFAAKRRGRGQLEIYSDALEKEVTRRAEIEFALRAPGVARDIAVVFQPILDLATMEVRSFEALARWRHNRLGWISPQEFIPISEQISAVEVLTPVLLRRAASEAVRWPSSVRLSFNLSAVELCSEGSAEQLISIVCSSGLDPSRLQIEVT